jgi:hypothetical protein
MSRTLGFLLATALALAISACATPARMHDEAQLNSVALGCGLALGELMQDESEKKLLLTVRSQPSPAQRVCVAQWARRNGLKPVFVTINFPEG